MRYLLTVNHDSVLRAYFKQYHFLFWCLGYYRLSANTTFWVFSLRVIFVTNTDQQCANSVIFLTTFVSKLMTMTVYVPVKLYTYFENHFIGKYNIFQQGWYPGLPDFSEVMAPNTGKK